MSLHVQNTGGGLTHAQRNRLIKSTRKLGMVLGETPTVDGVSESQSSSSSSLHRRPSTNYAASTSTKSFSSSESHGRPSLSLARTSTSSSTSSRPSLSLPVPPLPPTINISVLPSPLPSPTTAEGSSQQPSTPLSPTFVILNRDSPFCPTDSESESYRAANIRRKKMAKLVRTFGENVPPELVTIGHLGGGLSVDTTGGIGTTSGRAVRGRRSSQSLNEDALASSRRKYGGVDMKRLSSSTTASLSFSDSSSQCSVPYSTQSSTNKAMPTSISRSKSLYTSRSKASAQGCGETHYQAQNHHQRAVSTSENSTNADRELAFARLTGGDGLAPPEMIPTSATTSKAKKKNPILQQLVVPGTHRKGREWSGEWNQSDMQHVVNQLRRLK